MIKMVVGDAVASGLWGEVGEIPINPAIRNFSASGGFGSQQGHDRQIAEVGADAAVFGAVGCPRGGASFGPDRAVAGQMGVGVLLVANPARQQRDVGWKGGFCTRSRERESAGMAQLGGLIRFRRISASARKLWRDWPVRHDIERGFLV